MTAHYSSPLGGITLACDGESLTGLWFDGQKYFGSTLEEDRAEGGLPVFEQTREWLDAYFAGKRPDFTPPLKMLGTEFRKRVWDILQKIPYGELVSYGEIAAELAKREGLERMSARAVGGAVGHNPVSIIVPCHRVIGSNGRLTGYAGGIDKKIALLRLEGVKIKM